MAQDYGAAQPIANWVKDYVYAPVQKVLGTVDKLSVPQLPQKKEDTSQPKSDAKPSPPKYHKGTDYVPKTGPAVLKKGEAVLNEKDADKYRATKGKEMAKDTHSRAQSVLGGSHKSKGKKGKKPHSIHIKRGKSGGFIVQHHAAPDENGMTPPTDDPHVVPDMASLQSHIADNMGDQGPAPGPTAPDASAAAAGPGAGAPPAAPPAGAPPAGM